MMLKALPLVQFWSMLCVFFRDLSEVLQSMVRSIRFENVVDRSPYKFGGELAFFMRFGKFFVMKAG